MDSIQAGRQIGIKFGKSDIAHTGAFGSITIEWDKKFLVEQRTQGCRGQCASLDKAFLRKQRRANERAFVQKWQQLKSKKQLDELKSTAILETRNKAEISTEVSLPSSSDPKVIIRKWGRKTFMISELSACLDIAKASNRGALMIASETPLSFGVATTLTKFH